MKEFFGRKILKYQDQIFRDLKTLVAIPSVADASAARRPFGERSAETLRWILNRARELGLDTVSYTHLDVYKRQVQPLSKADLADYNGGASAGLRTDQRGHSSRCHAVSGGGLL